MHINEAFKLVPKVQAEVAFGNCFENFPRPPVATFPRSGSNIPCVATKPMSVLFALEAL